MSGLHSHGRQGRCGVEQAAVDNQDADVLGLDACSMAVGVRQLLHGAVVEWGDCAVGCGGPHG